MRLTHLLLCAAPLLPIMTSCQGPAVWEDATATLESGGVLDLRKSIPAPDPDKVALGEMSIRINSKLLDEEAKRDLAQGLALQSGGLRSWRTRDKDPEYRIVIHEMNSAEEWEASGMGAVLGAGIGGASGAMLDDENPYRGGGLGAMLGAGAGALLGSEQQSSFVFGISVYRRTSEGAVKERLRSLGQQGIAFAGGASGSTMSLGTSANSSSSASSVTFDSDEYPEYLAAVVTVRANGMHREATVHAAARKELVRALPGLIFGGEEIAF